MKTLITGGTGLIGSSLKGDYKLSSDDLNLLDMESSIKTISSINPDRIIHCAAILRNGSTISNNHFNHFYDNMVINLNMLKIASILNIKEILMVSTVNALPNGDNLTEEDLHLGPPRREMYSDGFVNRMLVVGSQMLDKESDVRAVYPLLTNIYGPCNKFTNGMIPFYIKKCIECKKDSKDLEVLGDGGPVRDFIFVGDLDKIFNWMFDNYFENDTLIISSGVRISIKEIIELIVKYVGFEGNIKWIKDNRFNKKDIKVFNNEKMNNLCNIEFTPIENGLKSTVEWWLENE
jgi:GDP-L-fucose synthase